jgi:transaldolase
MRSAQEAAMTFPLQSLIALGTKVWLDTVDPDEVARHRGGATGATSNPLIVADLIKTQ